MRDPYARGGVWVQGRISVQVFSGLAEYMKSAASAHFYGVVDTRRCNDWEMSMWLDDVDYM